MFSEEEGIRILRRKWKMYLLLIFVAQFLFFYRIDFHGCPSITELNLKEK